MDRGLARFATTLRRAREFGRFQVQIGKGRIVKTWMFEMSGEGVRIDNRANAGAELAIRLQEDDAWEILRGKVSPAEVYLRGRMLVTGDCDMARRLYQKIGSRGETDVR